MIIPGWLYNSSPHNSLDTGRLANPSLFLLPAFHLIPDHYASCTQDTSMSHVVSNTLLRLLISLSPLSSSSSFLCTLLICEIFFFHHFHLYSSLSPYIHIQYTQYIASLTFHVFYSSILTPICFLHTFSVFRSTFWITLLNSPLRMPPHLPTQLQLCPLTIPLERTKTNYILYFSLYWPARRTYAHGRGFIL